MNEDMKRVMMIIALSSGLVLIVFCILIFQVRAVTMLPSGQCEDVIYQTLNQSMNQSVNITRTFCAVNVTRSKLNFTINPGSNYIVNRTYCEVQGQCTSNSTHQTKCVIDDNADPGDNYNYQTAICDVRVNIGHCDTCNQDCTQGLPTKFSDEYQIQYSNQSKRIQFNFKDQERIWNLEDNINIKGTINYDCPLQVLNSSVGARVTAEQCRALGEVYCGDAFDLMTRKADEAVGRQAEYETKLENCRLEIQNMQTGSVCVTNEEYAKLKAENIVINNQTLRCSEEKGVINYQWEDSKANVTALMILALFSIAINIYQWLNPRQAPRSSKIGGAKM